MASIYRLTKTMSTLGKTGSYWTILSRNRTCILDSFSTSTVARSSRSVYNRKHSERVKADQLPYSAKVLSTASEAPPKPFSAMPGPKKLPFFGSSLQILKYRGNYLTYFDECAKIYGPIFHTQLGPIKMVILCDPDAVQKMFHSEGKYPFRMPIPIWEKWRQTHKRNMGVFLENGPEWRRKRTVLDKQLMKPSHVAGYADSINNVNADFIRLIKRVREDDGTVHDLDNHLFRWSLEGVSAVAYETRLGGLSETPSPQSEQFIKAVREMLLASEKLGPVPPAMAGILMPSWNKKHDQAWTAIFDLAEKIIDSKMKELVQKVDADEDTDSLLSTLIVQKQYTHEELYAIMTELMSAAVDTTSQTTNVMVHFLSKNPDVQDKIRQEIQSVLPDPEARASQTDLNSMPYLRATVREVQRFYTPALATRTLLEETESCGYKIPPGVLLMVYTTWMGKDPQYFPDPELFRPERWMREAGERSSVHPFASLPFGYGQRGCLGRRIAEMEMQLLTLELCRHFTIESVGDTPLEFATRLFIVPKNPVVARFIDRKASSRP